MVALIDHAHKRRAEAAKLRMDAGGLRLATRRQLRASRERMAAAEAARARLYVVLDAPVPSPWSDLPWRRRDPDVERTLVVR